MQDFLDKSCLFVRDVRFPRRRRGRRVHRFGVTEPITQVEEQGERLLVAGRCSRVLSHFALHYGEVIERKGLFQLVAGLAGPIAGPGMRASRVRSERPAIAA